MTTENPIPAPMEGAASGAVPPSGATPVAKLFAAWEAVAAAQDLACGAGLSDAEFVPLDKARWQIEKRLMATPCCDAADFVRKVAVHTSWGSLCLSDMGNPESFWSEARALIGGAGH